MQLSVIGSNSSGNAYILQASNGRLLIECGVSFTQIKRALGFNYENVAAIVSHCHGDHSKAIADVLKAGIPVYAMKDTLEAKGVLDHHRAHAIIGNNTHQIGAFRIFPFPVNHDVPCFGFLIYHPECGMTLFLTDTFYCDYTFPGLNNIIVEANHDTDILDNNGTPGFLRDRIIQSHMNLDTCKELLLANDLSAVNNIVLIHLSNSNSDARMFRKEIENITGKTVHIAEAGMVVPFNKTAI
jgi:phosphoribosyl 1,2-cyclic phosphodiesterase